VEGGEKVSGVRFEDGTVLKLDGVFVALGTAGSTSIARTMGILLEGSSIRVDEHMATNIPGVFAAGDCTGGLLQIAKAVHEGAEAGLSAVKYLRRS
jgi:thioredoxin reductase (NADPH)